MIDVSTCDPVKCSLLYMRATGRNFEEDPRTSAHETISRLLNQV